MNFATYAVRDSQGRIDRDETLTKFAADLSVYEAERETEAEVIAEAVDAVFDKHLGARVNMPALTSFALQVLNAQPENFKALGERVADYIRENAQGAKDEAGNVERPDSKYVIGKGKGGGVRRRCDIVEAPASTDSE